MTSLASVSRQWLPDTKMLVLDRQREGVWWRCVQAKSDFQKALDIVVRCCQKLQDAFQIIGFLVDRTYYKMKMDALGAPTTYDCASYGIRAAVQQKQTKRPAA